MIAGGEGFVESLDEKVGAFRRGEDKGFRTGRGEFGEESGFECEYSG